MFKSGYLFPDLKGALLFRTVINHSFNFPMSYTLWEIRGDENDEIQNIK
jgi:hypothetical protein